MMKPNKFNIGDKVWFKLDSYGKKAERYGTICSSILCDPISGWQYDIETGDNKHWNIPEKDIDYTAPHTRESNKLEKELEDRKKMCRNCKWCYLTGSSEPCKSCANSSKRNLNWEPEGGICPSDNNDYKVGDIVRYHVMDVDKTELKEGKIVSKDSVHYDFRITDIFDGMTWGVNKEWIVEKVVTVILSDLSMVQLDLK